MVGKDLLPPDGRAHAWHAPTRTSIANASGQAIKTLARLSVALHVHEKPMSLPFIVSKRHSVPLIIGSEFKRQVTRTVLPQDGKIQWTTGAVLPVLGNHLGARWRQYRPTERTRARANELTLAGVPILPPGTQTEVQVVTLPTLSYLPRARKTSVPNTGCNRPTGVQTCCAGMSRSQASLSTWVAPPHPSGGRGAGHG